MSSSPLSVQPDVIFPVGCPALPDVIFPVGCPAAAKLSDRKTTKDRWHKSFMRLPHVFDHSEHHNHKTSLSTPVSIFETEPTSIIAFALSSQQYATQMSAGRRGFGTGGEAKATVSPKL